MNSFKPVIKFFIRIVYLFYTKFAIFNMHIALPLSLINLLCKLLSVVFKLSLSRMSLTSINTNNLQPLPSSRPCFNETYLKKNIDKRDLTNETKSNSVNSQIHLVTHFKLEYIFLKNILPNRIFFFFCCFWTHVCMG